jgi:3-oxoacyl-[acyl-carrier protein] reductase
MPADAPAHLAIPDLAGKVVLITGASTGIGAALARAFGAQGAKVGVHYNSSVDAAEAVAKSISDAGGEAFLTRGDVSVSANTRRIVEETASHFGRLDGLINNAGLMLGRVNWTDMSDEQYDKVMDLNGRSVVAACRAAIPLLKKAGGGFIINTSSIAARTGGAGGAGVYAASKAFVTSLTRGMSKELVGSGIRVNAVAPGVILTPFHERYSSPEQLKTMLGQIPMARYGVPDDCVGAYLFLASAALSGYIIGQVIEVNGGQLMP